MDGWIDGLMDESEGEWMDGPWERYIIQNYTRAGVA
jgi:hypothetical protein